MREHEIEGLADLKEQYKHKLVAIKPYQALRAQFLDESMELVKRAIGDKIKFTPEMLDAKFKPMLAAKGCGFCTSCITDCSSCVAYS